MSEKVKSAGIKREKDWLYYLDRNLNLLRAKLVRGGKKKQAGSKPELLLKTGLQRDSSYIYYLDLCYKLFHYQYFHTINLLAQLCNFCNMFVNIIFGYQHHF